MRVATTQDFLDTFDHVVVLMMENRSFDSCVLPKGKTFAGAQGQWNPDHKGPDHKGKVRIATSLTRDLHEPYPDSSSTTRSRSVGYATPADRGFAAHMRFEVVRQHAVRRTIGPAARRHPIVAKAELRA